MNCDVNDRYDDKDIENIEDIVNESDVKVNEIKSKIEKINDLRRELQLNFDKLSPMLNEIGPLLDKLECLCQLENLLQKLQIIKDINERLQQNSDVKDKEFDNRVTIIINNFKALIYEYENFKGSKESPLKQYIRNVIIYWRDILLEKFEKKFTQTFDSVQWPLGIGINAKKPVLSNADSFNNFVLYFNALLSVDIENTIDSIDDSTRECTSITCLPLQIMIKPLKKRFHFHFIETKSKLNRLEKPEWHLSQILTWIKMNESFLYENVDSLLRGHFTNKLLSSKIQLTYELLYCVSDKLKMDLPSLVYDDKLFTHTVDEVLLFTREMQIIEPAIYQFNGHCNLLNLFSVEPYFTRLLNIERKRATDFVEFILDSTTAWTMVIGSESKDDALKVTECVDSFVLMLQSVTDRCSFLSEPSHKHAFVKLQLEILDDFRLRLTQLLHGGDASLLWPLSHRYFAIANNVNYLIVVLEEWKNLPYFVALSEIYSPNGTLFDGIIELFEHMRKELHNQIIDLFMREAIEKMRIYQKTKWFCMKEVTSEMSPNACQLLHFISTALVLLQNSLADPLFESTLHEIANRMNRTLLKEVVMGNSFNHYGAKQFEFDITTCFMSLFHVYMQKPETTFTEIIEASKLLNLQRGTALLFQDSLKNPNSRKEALKEMKIESLSADSVIIILKKRIYS